MSRGDAWMPLYVGDYLRDTGHLTNGEHGSYFLLLMHAWTNDGELPNDEDRLRILAKMDSRGWRRSRPIIMAFFHLHEGVYRNKRIDQELSILKGNIDQKRAAGKASAEARAKAAERQRETNDRSAPVELPLQRNGNPSPSPVPKKEKKGERANGESAPSARATRLPDGWSPNEAGSEFARSLGVNRIEIDKFHDYWRSQPGQKGVKADWEATWRNWCRKAVEYSGGGLLAENRPKPPDRPFGHYEDDEP